MVKLGEIARFVNGAAFKPTDWTETGYPIIRIQNLTNQSTIFNRTHREVKEELYVKEGDILVSWSATLDVFRWNRSETAVLNQHIFKVCDVRSDVDRDYLYFGLAYALEQAERHLHGATMRHINRQEFLSLKLPLPPIEEQRRIAEMLNQVSESVHRNDQQIELQYGLLNIDLGQYTGKEISIADIATPRSGQIDPTLPEFQDIRHVAPNCITSGIPEIMFANTCAEDEVTSGKYQFQRGDVLYSKIRPYLNKVAIPDFNGVCSADMYALEPKEPYSSQFVRAVLMSRQFLDYVEKESGRASIPKINRNSLLKFTFPAPTNEQLNELTQRAISIEKSISLLRKRSLLLSELLSATTQKAF